MSNRLQTYRNVVSDAVDAWQSRVCNPYIVAYNTAYRSYLATFNKQNESNRARAEMFVAMASIVPGSILMATAASSSMRLIAHRAALSMLARRNATRTLARYEALAADATTKFAVGKVLDIVKNDVGKTIKDAVTKAMTNTTNLFDSDPLNRDKQLNSWLLEHKLAALDAGKAIEDSRVLTSSAKDAAFAQLRLAPIANRPNAVLASNPLAEKIEHGFYMVWLLDSDALVTQTAAPMGYFPGSYSSTPIDVLPSSPLYPRSRGDGRQWVGVSRPGGDVEDRIDELNKKLLGKKFYESGFFGKDDRLKLQEVRAAEQVLQWLSNATQPLEALGVRS